MTQKFTREELHAGLDSIFDRGGEGDVEEIALHIKGVAVALLMLKGPRQNSAPEETAEAEEGGVNITKSEVEELERLSYAFDGIRHMTNWGSKDACGIGDIDPGMVAMAMEPITRSLLDLASQIQLRANGGVQ